MVGVNVYPTICGDNPCTAVILTLNPERVFPCFVQEVFVRRSYLQHGLIVSDGAVVIDAGANIGLFSLQCLREATGVQVMLIAI